MAYEPQLPIIESQVLMDSCKNIMKFVFILLMSYVNLIIRPTEKSRREEGEIFPPLQCGVCVNVCMCVFLCSKTGRVASACAIVFIFLLLLDYFCNDFPLGVCVLCVYLPVYECTCVTVVH